MRKSLYPSFCFILLLCSLNVPPASAQSLFMIDTPAILRTALSAAYREHPDIPEGGLLMRGHEVPFRCSPGEKYVFYPGAGGACPDHRHIASACQAEVEFVLRDSLQRDIAALRGGNCRFTASYKSISVRVYRNFETQVFRSGYLLEQSAMGPCADTEGMRLVEPAHVIDGHEKILTTSFGHTTPPVPAVSNRDSGITVPAGGPEAAYHVDYANLYRLALSGALAAYPGIPPGELALRSNDIGFECDSGQNWRAVDPATLEIPAQAHASSVCHAVIDFAIKSSVKKRPGEGGQAGSDCHMAFGYQSIQVELYPEGSIETRKVGGSQGYRTECDHEMPLYSLDDMIQRFHQTEYPVPPNPLRQRPDSD